MTALLVRLSPEPYLFDPCEPTDTPPGAGPGGFGSWPASPCLAACAQPGAAQERKYLVELGAAGAYQSFDTATELDGAAGGLGRLGVWLPLNFSVGGRGRDRQAQDARPRPGGQRQDLRRLGPVQLPARRQQLVLPQGRRRHDQVRRGTARACASAGEPICGSSGALLAGTGFRVGLTPTVMPRPRALYNRNKSKARPTAPASPLSNYGGQPRPEPDAGQQAHPRQRRRRRPRQPRPVRRHARRAPGRQPRLPERQRRRRRARRGGPLLRPRWPGAAVDDRGCSRDSDGDNIPDGLDRCPDTPAGVLVDPRGCPKDSDGDGIPDGLDRCSETPRGATVDALGCPGDEDGDGVLDGLDRCPRTPAGAAVNASGCAPGQAPGRPGAGGSAPPAASRRSPIRRPQPGPAARRARPSAGQPPPRTAAGHRWAGRCSART